MLTHPRGLVRLCAALFLTAACSTPTVGENANCVDVDGDGHGEGCAAGPDCDDVNAALQVCDCAMGNFAGCACEAGAEEPCFEGLPDQLDVGVCHQGRRSCENDAWSVCRGQRAPTQELCNDRDDDCDGDFDEGLPDNGCGTCDPTCTMTQVGVGGDPWDTSADNPRGLSAGPDGLTLQPGGDPGELSVLWIANNEEGTVSKLDARNGRELGRYVSAREVHAGMADPLTPCSSGGNCPSRTAVDVTGGVWVANRALGIQGSVTRIAHAHADCLDRDEDGVLQTSADANNDGRIDINDPAEFFGAQDECILFTHTVGSVDGKPRALALDPLHPSDGIGSAWVGSHGDFKYYQLSAADGSVLREVAVPHEPYGAVLDRAGTLWSITLNDGAKALVSVESETGEVTGVFSIASTNDCANSYGVTIDGQGHVWIAGYKCAAAFRYTPRTGEWLTVDFGTPGLRARGIAVDENDKVWVGTSHLQETKIARLVSFNTDGTGLDSFDLSPEGEELIGVGIDPSGKVWGVNRNTNNAVRFDPATRTAEFFPVGAGPYTYSDFTGHTLQNFIAPQGTYRHIFEGCPGGASALWQRLEWQADLPAGAGIRVRAKVANDLAGLGNAPVVGTWTEGPVELDGAYGRYLEVFVTLTARTPNTQPRLTALAAASTCPPVE